MKYAATAAVWLLALNGLYNLWQMDMSLSRFEERYIASIFFTPIVLYAAYIITLLIFEVARNLKTKNAQRAR